LDAASINVGDKILQGELLNCHNNGKGHSNKIFLGNEELAWCFGFFAAEGSAFVIDGNYKIKFSNKNVDALCRCKSAIEANMNIVCQKISPVGKDDMISLHCNGFAVYSFFKERFYNRCGEKRVPTEILNAPLAIRSAFIDGYMEGDGHYSRGKYPSFTTKSWILAQGLVWLFNSLGNHNIVVHVRKDKPSVVHVSVNVSNCRIKCPEQVKKIESVSYSGMVYDLATDDGKFQTGVGTIFAHNTGSTDATKEIARKYTSKVFDSEKFNKDTNIADFEFGVAKNEAIRKCTCDWIMWCLTPDMQILTSEGYKRIDTIGLRDLVYTHRGRFKRVVRTMKRHVKEPLLKIGTHMFNEKIKITKNHEVLAIKSHKCKFRKWCQPNCARQKHPVTGYTNCQLGYKDYKLEWMTPDSLEVGDILVFPVPNLAKMSVSSYKLNLTKSHKDVPEDLILTPDLMRLFGYYLAEGHLDYGDSDNPVRINFAFHVRERDYQNDVISLMSKCFNLKSSVVMKDAENSCILRFCSAPVARLFENLFGRGAYNKDFPSEWLHLDKLLVTNLFKGWYLGDGGYQKDTHRGRSVSRGLIEKFQMVLISLGIVPYLQRDKYGYNLKIGGRQLEKFRNVFDIEHPFVALRTSSYQKYFYADEKYVYYPIRSIEEIIYDGLVYNLEVEDDNSYVAQYVTVHNCDADDVVDEDNAKRIKHLADVHPQNVLFNFTILYGILRFEHCRMFPNAKGIFFDEGHACHEYLNTQGLQVVRKPEIVVHHNAGEKQMATCERNKQILETDYFKRHREDQRTLFYLASAYRECGENEKAIEFYDSYLNKSQWKEERLFARIYRAECLRASGRWDDARNELLRAIMEDDRYAEPYCDLGDMYFQKAEKRLASCFYRMATTREIPDDSMLFTTPLKYSSYPEQKIRECEQGTETPAVELPCDGKAVNVYVADSLSESLLATAAIADYKRCHPDSNITLFVKDQSKKQILNGVPEYNVIIGNPPPDAMRLAVPLGKIRAKKHDSDWYSRTMGHIPQQEELIPRLGFDQKALVQAREYAKDQDFVILQTKPDFQAASWNEDYWTEIVSFLKSKDFRIFQVEGELVQGAELIPGSADFVKALISIASFAISVDGWLHHVTASFGTPTMVLWGPTVPEVRGYSSQVNIKVRDMDCQPCWNGEKCKKNFECLREIKPQNIIDCISSALEEAQ
jgi:tetratricopeptide (TPR) repeat protein